MIMIWFPNKRARYAKRKGAESGNKIYWLQLFFYWFCWYFFPFVRSILSTLIVIVVLCTTIKRMPSALHLDDDSKYIVSVSGVDVTYLASYYFQTFLFDEEFKLQ